MRRILTLLVFAVNMRAQNVVTTVAGLDPIFTGDGQKATDVALGYVNGVATDSAGNIYFTDPLEHLVLRVSPAGILTVLAGNGVAAYSGDGGPATAAGIASFDSPDQYVGRTFPDSLGGIAVDGAGNVYFADGHYVRRVTPDGVISTVAGGGSNLPGDGGPATRAQLGIVNGVVLDSSGNLYFSEGNRIRRVTRDGTISTYAGNGANGYAGDGGPAIAATLSQPLGLAFDSLGDLYFADGDTLNFATHIRRISVTGTITTFAGGGNVAPANNVTAASVNLGAASGVAVDASGAVYVYSPLSGFLLKIVQGRVTVLTNPGTGPFTDNVPARGAFVSGLRIYDSSGIALDKAGNLYVADSTNTRLRKIDGSGQLTTVAGNGLYGYSGDGGPALGASIQGPTQMTQTPDGTVYFLDTLNQRVRAISPAGIIRTALPNANFSGITGLNGIASDAVGNVYVLLGRKLLKLAPDGTVATLLNTAGKLGDSGDGGLATDAAILAGGGLARDAAGNLYLSDANAHRIRKITPDGKIQTIAGTGVAGISPDGSLAAVSPITEPTALLVDASGGLYFEESPADTVGSAVIRYIMPNGRLNTIAGDGSGGFSGDGGLATAAGLMMQKRTGLALDANGRLLIADGFNSRVRVVNRAGVISTFAGSGNDVSAGDGLAARNASFLTPRGLLYTANGDLLISDVAANRIRAVLAASPAVSVTPAQMSFTAKAGGAQTAPQKFTTVSPVSGLGFTVAKSSGADWLIVAGNAPTVGGLTPRIINVRADPTNLTPGVYTATLTVTVPLAAPATSTISVTFTVTPGDNPKLALDKGNLSFTFPRNPTTTRALALRVTNAGTGSLAYKASVLTATGGAWLSVAPQSGTATPNSPAHLLITAKPAGLAVGTYTGSVTVTSSTTGETASVPVTLTISTLDQAIQLSQAALSFQAVQNGGIVPPATFAVINIGRGAMPFTVSTRTLAGGSWLSATPASSTAVNSSVSPRITVSVDPAGLAPDTYYGLVQIDSPAAANTPQLVTVTLRVLPASQDPGPMLVPNELVFTAAQGANSPGAKEVLVYNISATPQTYVSSSVFATPDSTFNFVPQHSTLSLTEPERIVVQPMTSTLAPGVYDGDLTLQFSDGSVRRAVIRTIVTPSTTVNKSARDAVTCTPTKLLPSLNTLGQSFGVPAAWPVALEANVQDDCGNPLQTGSVSVEFSNGDPPLAMAALDSGLWTVTWASGNSSGPVTVTVNAQDPARSLTGSRDVTGGVTDSAKPPVVSAAVNAASFVSNAPLAPNSLISVFGSDLSNGVAQPQTLPLPTLLGGASVLIAGRPQPLVYGSNGQINAVVGSGVNVNTSHQVLIQRDTTLSIPVRIDVAPAAPGIFMYSTSKGVIVNAINYALAQQPTPATAGDILAIFATGLGAVDASIADGTASPSSPLANTTSATTVTIGGQSAPVAFAGLAPGFVGLYQIDVTVPAGVQTGDAVPVIVTVAGQASPPATIAIR